MADGSKGFDKALMESWHVFRKKLPGGIGEYMDPKTAYEKIIRKNGAAVLTEIRESREAVRLLWKMASGIRITEDEQRKLKEQLADLAKTIPALTIFTLPGGALLLPILAKSLPWNILPSAFKKNLDKDRVPADDNKQP